jgi:predicted DNA binding protein
MERELLSDIADAVAFATHTIQTSQSLASGSLLEVQATVRDTAHYLVEVIDGAGQLPANGKIAVLGTLPEDDAVTQYVELDAGSLAEFEQAAEAHPDITAVEVIDSDRRRLRVTVDRSVPERDLATAGARVTETTVTGGQTTVTFQIPSSRNVEDVLATAGEEWRSASITALTEPDDVGQDASTRFSLDGTDLTDKQRAALEAAYHHGYFEQPRQSSASEIASALGVTHSTFLQHLRVAQQKIFGDQFG